jgi:23S rRNA (cytosine1962-C5)-methyltransferase
VGRGFYSEASKIAVRMLTREEVAIDVAFFARRLDAAIARRATLLAETDAYRVVHGEGDLLPGLVVDRYGDVLVLQSTAPGVEVLLPMWLDLLGQRFDARSIVLRNDVPVRRLEGLPLEVRVEGAPIEGPLWVRDGDLSLRVDPRSGQKTGLYLDQRHNHRRARELCAGARVLDVFCYQGGFALPMARTAAHVVAVDASADALALLGENARSNGLENIEPVKAKAADELRRRVEIGDQFDVVVLDPPAFAKSRQDVERATRGYLDINLRALKLLREGGLLITCSCSYNLGPEEFRHVLRGAAAEAGVAAVVIEQGMQALDHPVLLTHPESWYLKSLYLRRLQAD